MGYNIIENGENGTIRSLVEKTESVVENFLQPYALGSKMQVLKGVNETPRILGFSFPMANGSEYWEANLINYIRELLCLRKDNGSLFKLLEKENLILSISIGDVYFKAAVDSLIIWIYLTDEGVKKIDRIGEILFSYLAMLKKEAEKLDEEGSLEQERCMFKDLFDSLKVREENVFEQMSSLDGVRVVDEARILTARLERFKETNSNNPLPPQSLFSLTKMRRFDRNLINDFFSLLSGPKAIDSAQVYILPGDDLSLKKMSSTQNCPVRSIEFANDLNDKGKYPMLDENFEPKMHRVPYFQMDQSDFLSIPAEWLRKWKNPALGPESFNLSLPVYTVNPFFLHKKTEMKRLEENTKSVSSEVKPKDRTYFNVEPNEYFYQNKERSHFSYEIFHKQNSVLKETPAVCLSLEILTGQKAGEETEKLVMTVEKMYSEINPYLTLSSAKNVPQNCLLDVWVAVRFEELMVSNANLKQAVDAGTIRIELGVGIKGSVTLDIQAPNEQLLENVFKAVCSKISTERIENIDDLLKTMKDRFKLKIKTKENSSIPFDFMQDAYDKMQYGINEALLEKNENTEKQLELVQSIASKHVEGLTPILFAPKNKIRALITGNLTRSETKKFVERMDDILAEVFGNFFVAGKDDTQKHAFSSEDALTLISSRVSRDKVSDIPKIFHLNPNNSGRILIEQTMTKKNETNGVTGLYIRAPYLSEEHYFCQKENNGTECNSIEGIEDLDRVLEKEAELNIYVSLFGLVLEDAFYDSLKNDKQLAYALRMSSETICSGEMFHFYVQSHIASPDIIARHIEECLVKTGKQWFGGFQPSSGKRQQWFGGSEEFYLDDSEMGENLFSLMVESIYENRKYVISDISSIRSEHKYWKANFICNHFLDEYESGYRNFLKNLYRRDHQNTIAKMYPKDAKRVVRLHSHYRDKKALVMLKNFIEKETGERKSENNEMRTEMTKRKISKQNFLEFARKICNLNRNQNITIQIFPKSGIASEKNSGENEPQVPTPKYDVVIENSTDLKRLYENVEAIPKKDLNSISKGEKSNLQENSWGTVYNYVWGIEKEENWQKNREEIVY